jgi:hypothetical protein
MVQTGTVSDGLSSVAQHLGLSPADTYFMHSTVVDPDDVKVGMQRRELRHFALRYAQVLPYVSPSSGNPGAKAIVLPIAESALSYFDACGLARREDVVQVGKRPKSWSYPHASVARQLADELRWNTDLRRALRGKTLISSALTNDDLQVSDLSGCRLLMKPEAQLPFNSKTYLRENAALEGYLVPVGVEISSMSQLDEKWKILVDLAVEQNLPSDVTIWVKLDSRSSGKGTITARALNDESLQLVRDTFRNHAATLGVASDGPFPFVIEVAVEDHPEVTVLANVGVQAVLSECESVIVGSTVQRTLNGRYIGCVIDDDAREHALIAEAAASPALSFYQRMGYRGFLNFDVIVVRHTNGTRFGYLIDPNARLTGATPLLSVVQRNQRARGCLQVGLSYSNYIDATDDSFQTAIEMCGNALYMGDSSNYQGIIPALVNDINARPDGKTVATVIVTGDSTGYVHATYDAYKSRLRSSKR